MPRTAGKGLRALALISVSVLCIGCLPLQHPPAGRGMAAFVDDYFDALFEWSPTSATAWGNHDHDARIEALLRDVRYVVAIKLHTAGWTVEQGAKLFEEKAFQTPANAYEEARRGTYDPSYLNYTLGKLQIYKLREDYRKVRGATYSLQRFHDEFVKQGSIPLKAVRRILLPGDKAPTL